jgi:hypothetical protein
LALCCALARTNAPLENGLGIKGKAFCGPRAPDAARGHGLGYIGLKLVRVGRNLAVTQLPDLRMGLVGLLHHCAQQTGRLRQLAQQDRLAELHIARQTVHRVGKTAVGSRLKQPVGTRGEMLGGGQGQLFLTSKVVKKAPLGEPWGQAHIFDPRG